MDDYGQELNDAITYHIETKERKDNSRFPSARHEEAIKRISSSVKEVSRDRGY